MIIMHHADPLGVYQAHRVDMVLKCRTGELLTRVAFIHHDDREIAHTLSPNKAMRSIKS